MDAGSHEGHFSEKFVAVGVGSFDSSVSRSMKVEASFGRGFSGIQMIGNIGSIVEDGRERARMALERLGYQMPARKMLLSFTPGDRKVDGNHFDLGLAVALACLTAQQVPKVDLSRWVFAAEIGIGGQLRAIKGAIGLAVDCMAEGMDGIVVANDNAEELQALQTACVDLGRPLRFLNFQTLEQVLDWVWGKAGAVGGLSFLKSPQNIANEADKSPSPNFDDMILDEELKQVALVAATGMHSLMLRGVPGCGKSMFAKRLVSLLPKLSAEEHLTLLQNCSSHREAMSPQVLQGCPPFRNPHHFASAPAILGAGALPGEAALAYGGILFMDEFPEFRRDVIEGLREPLETGEIVVSRAQMKRVWKADLMLVAAANNCPCGWRGSKRRRCECHETRVVAYRNRLSGPILDRIDLHVNMPERSESSNPLFAASRTEGVSKTLTMKAMVSEARAFGLERNKSFGIKLNKQIQTQGLAEILGWTASALDTCISSIIPSHVSSRSVVRCLRIARTLADLKSNPIVAVDDIRKAWSWQAHQSAVLRGEIFN